MSSSAFPTIPLIGLLLVLHLATPALAVDEARARNLVNSLGCKGCHPFEGSGGSLGSALDRIGRTLSKEQIIRKLVEPKANNPNSMMPGYGQISDADIDALAEYLAARK